MKETIMGMAETLAMRSTCKRAKVGALLVTTDLRQVLAMGYNSPASGISNDACTNVTRSCGCIHAEVNCLLTARPHVSTVLFSTREPCHICTRLICNAPDIRKIIWPIDKWYFDIRDEADCLLRAQGRRQLHKVGMLIEEL